MKLIDRRQLEKAMEFPQIVKALAEGFRRNLTVPPRPHFQYENPEDRSQSTLLFMPAWGLEGFMGLKIVTVTPGNSRRNIPAIQGIYLLLNMQTGETVAQFDAPSLTYLRTAGTSALASRFLSREDSSRLLMVGTGRLIPYLISAHISVRPIKEIMIWGRDYEKASGMVNALKEQSLNNPLEIYPLRNLDEAVPRADIISAATMSHEPLVRGLLLLPGQHLDLVGSYLPNLRETDDEAIRKASIYIDNHQAIVESGDLKQPIYKGVIGEQDIVGDIFKLCRNEISGRQDRSQITLFKSVGHASQDLILAVEAYRSLT